MGYHDRVRPTPTRSPTGPSLPGPPETLGSVVSATHPLATRLRGRPGPTVYALRRVTTRVHPATVRRYVGGPATKGTRPFT